MKKHYYFVIMTLGLILLYACKDSAVDKKISESEPINDIALKDTLKPFTSSQKSDIPTETKTKAEQHLKRYSYPNMSHCGGSLDGLYDGDKLIRIESTYGAEFGFSSKDVDFVDNKVVTISYREYFADYDKYRLKYPKDEGFDEKKMMYTDTLYVFNFGKVNSCKIYAKKKLVSTKIDESLLNRLLACVETMKDELESEKHIEK